MNAATPKLATPIAANHLYYGDNLEILRDHIPDERVDRVYLDPPFNSQANYNVLFKAPSGEQSRAQIEAFDDLCHWNLNAEDALDRLCRAGTRRSLTCSMRSASFSKTTT
jgi:site-specific DNA-methyltransferase (adenine-specific)